MIVLQLVIIYIKPYYCSNNISIRIFTIRNHNTISDRFAANSIIIININFAKVFAVSKSIT